MFTDRSANTIYTKTCDTGTTFKEPRCQNISPLAFRMLGEVGEIGNTGVSFFCPTNYDIPSITSQKIRGACQGTGQPGALVAPGVRATAYASAYRRSKDGLGALEPSQRKRKILPGYNRLRAKLWGGLGPRAPRTALASVKKQVSSVVNSFLPSPSGGVGGSGTAALPQGCSPKRKKRGERW